MQQSLPKESDILQGVISRIEAYGAFCRLNGHGRLQGLIHISQLSDQKVERVEDVVSIDETVWIKVLQVEMDGDSQRWKIRLSMKDVSQDGLQTDLGELQHQKEIVRNQLETNLNSAIGMGVARDPMAGGLRLKKNEAKDKKVFYGGYTLVCDDEGEPPLPAVEPPVVQQLPAVGRGRGATLPAWMTQKADGPTCQYTDDSSDSYRERKRKRKHKKESKKRERKHRKHSHDRQRNKHRH